MFHIYSIIWDSWRRAGFGAFSWKRNTKVPLKCLKIWLSNTMDTLTFFTFIWIRILVLIFSPCYKYAALCTYEYPRSLMSFIRRFGFIFCVAIDCMYTLEVAIFSIIISLHRHINKTFYNQHVLLYISDTWKKRKKQINWNRNNPK